jgi:hypothetical protein
MSHDQTSGLGLRSLAPLRFNHGICLCRLGYLLALMEFADPRLIFRKGSKPEGPFRFGGSRSDLFASLFTGLAQPQKITLSFAELRDKPTYADELLYSRWYSRS